VLEPADDDGLEAQEYSGRADGYQPLSTEHVRPPTCLPVTNALFSFNSHQGVPPTHTHESPYRKLAPYALIVLVVLLFVWRFAMGHSAPPIHQFCVDGPNTTRYTVVKGDSCWEVANQHGITLDDLRNETLNPGLDCGKLRPGDILCLPVSV